MLFGHTVSSSPPLRHRHRLPGRQRATLFAGRPHPRSRCLPVDRKAFSDHTDVEPLPAGQALIAAAGKRTRLRSLTLDRPNPLPTGGRGYRNLVGPLRFGTAEILLRLCDFFAGTFVALCGDLYAHAQVGTHLGFQIGHCAAYAPSLHHPKEPALKWIVALEVPRRNRLPFGIGSPKRSQQTGAHTSSAWTMRTTLTSSLPTLSNPTVRSCVSLAIMR